MTKRALAVRVFGVFFCVTMFTLWVFSQNKEPPLPNTPPTKSIVEHKLDSARETIKKRGGQDKMRRSLETELVTYVDGQRIYVERSWYSLTVQHKEAAVYMMAAIYGMSTIHVIDGYSRARLGMFDKSMGWIQNQEDQ